MVGERQMTVAFLSVLTHSPHGSLYFYSQTSTSSLGDMRVTGCNLFGNARIHNFLNGIANSECCARGAEAHQIRHTMVIWYSDSGSERTSIFNLQEVHLALICCAFHRHSYHIRLTEKNVVVCNMHARRMLQEAFGDVSG